MLALERSLAEDSRDAYALSAMRQVSRSQHARALFSGPTTPTLLRQPARLTATTFTRPPLSRRVDLDEPAVGGVEDAAIVDSEVERRELHDGAER
jgi:hypothetical protein